MQFDEPAYRAHLGTNLEFDTTTLRFEYTSMKTPLSIYDYDMDTRQRTLLKREEVLGGFDPDDYVTERLHARARRRHGDSDFACSIAKVLKKRRRQSALALRLRLLRLRASMRRFASPRLSLIDRGFVFAIAHIRGGQEMGRPVV